MKGFRHTGNGPSSGHAFPGKFGFSGSAKPGISGFSTNRPPMRKAIGGVVDKAPPRSADGNSAHKRTEPPTQQLAEHGGKGPLMDGYCAGGATGFKKGGRKKFAKGGSIHDNTNVSKEADGSGDYKRGGSAKGFKKGGKKWIQKAIKHPGAEKKAAKRAGMSTHAFMEKNKNKPGKAGNRARLGLRLEGMHHHAKGGMHSEHESGLSHVAKGFETKAFAKGGHVKHGSHGHQHEVPGHSSHGFKPGHSHYGRYSHGHTVHRARGGSIHSSFKRYP